MQKYIDFLEHCAIDPMIYWRIPEQGRDELFELQWRSSFQKAWRFRKVGSLFWQLSDSQNLLDELRRAGLDLAFFESKLKHTILQQVAYANKVVTDARRLFGDDPVDEAIYENQQFMQQLEETIRSLTNTSKLESIKQPQSPHSRPRLQLIRPEDTTRH